jgi:hypothetical protein
VDKVFEARVGSDGFRWSGLWDRLAWLNEHFVLEIHTLEYPKALKKGVTRTRPI